MKKLLILWIFSMAVIRLINYILCVFDAAYLFNFIIAGLIIFIYICFRLLFFFSPTEITIDQIIEKKNNWHLIRNNKYYFCLLKLAYIFGKKSCSYYDSYFAKSYVLLFIFRKYFQSHTFTYYVFKVIQAYIRSYRRKLTELVDELFYTPISTEPEKPLWKIVPNEMYPNEKVLILLPEYWILEEKKRKAEKIMFSHHYKTFSGVVLHYSLIILWFVPFKNETFLDKLKVMVINAKSGWLDSCIKDCSLHLDIFHFFKMSYIAQAPTDYAIIEDGHLEYGYFLRMVSPITPFDGLIEYWDVTTVDRGLVLWYHSAYKDTTRYKKESFYQHCFSDDYPLTREINEEFANWCLNFNHMNYLEFRMDLNPLDRFDFFDSYVPGFMIENSFFNADQALQPEDFEHDTIHQDYLDNLKLVEDGSLSLFSQGAYPLDSFVINVSSIFLILYYMLLIIFSIILLSRRIQVFCLTATCRDQYKLLCLVQGLIFAYLFSYMTLGSYFYMLLWIVLKILHIDFFVVDYYLQIFIDILTPIFETNWGDAEFLIYPLSEAIIF
jgi:hypothetical protein